MRLLNGFGCFLCGSLAFLWIVPANPDVHVKLALAPLNAIAALARPESRTALADPDGRATLADPVIKVPPGRYH